MLSNATAWFKTYHPEIFMAATLNSFLKKRDKLKLYMTIAKRMGIEVLPPDVNRSRDTFAVEDGKIRFGLRGLRGMGAMAARLVAEREENGLFRDPQEVVERMVVGYGFSEEHIRSLIRSGGMDAFGYTRQALSTVVPDWKKLAGSLKKSKVNKDQMSMFDLMEAEEADAFRHLIPVPDMEEMDHRSLLEFENDTAGLYISGHPLDDYTLLLRQEKVDDIGFILEETGAFDEEEDMEMDDEYVQVKVTSDMDGKLVKIAGIISTVETFFTKKDGSPIKKIHLEDRTGGIDCVAFSDTIEKNSGLFMEKLLVQVEGRIKIDDFGVSINIRSITLLDEKKTTATKFVELRTENKQVARDFLEYVKANPGPIETRVTMAGKTFRLPASLHPSKQASLFDLYGEAISLHN